VSSEPEHILDTVVLLYFLLAEQEDLLGGLVGWPLRVPLAVFDPDDWAGPPKPETRLELSSEIRQAVQYFDDSALDTGDTGAAFRISNVDRMCAEGRLTPEALDAAEQRLADELQGAKALQLGLRAPLGPGESACVAIAFNRGWTMVTDDNDALKALSGLCVGSQVYAYERIRKLLIRAAREDRISEEEANQIHDQMTSYGFWDSQRPF